MFRFLRRSRLDRLRRQHQRLLEQAHRLSTTNRRLSDEKTAEAALVLQEIETRERLEELS